ncbi:RimJ/RimL family protein N-acetyltransferase [Pseudomonas sp. TE3786]
MGEIIELQTERLLLRTWRDEDLLPFAEMVADPMVMRYFPATQNRAEAAALIERVHAHSAEHGFGLWALERKDNGAFIGFTGLGVVGFDAPFCQAGRPTIEIGWRLARHAWGQGFASEAARAALACAFEHLHVPQVVAFTVPANRPSRAVMERIGMQRDPGDDFLHPNLPADHPLRPHVLYRLRREQWLAQKPPRLD